MDPCPSNPIAPNQSPALDGLAISLKVFSLQGLSKKVCPLFVGGTFDNIEQPLVVLLPKPVPFCKEVLGPAGDPLVCGQVVGTLVIFKHCGVELDLVEWLTLDFLDHFFHELFEGKKYS